MVRADLRNALVLDREIFEASRVDASLLDPVVRVEGALPGKARPITVLREYQGPQGRSIEFFELSDASGRLLFRSRLRQVQLTGEMFEDRFVDVVSGVRIERSEEHTMRFFVNDAEIGSIPVFIESGLGGDPAVAARETFNKALSKGAVLWVGVEQPPARKRPAATHTQPVWYVWTDGKVFVLDGPSEQQVPGLPTADSVELTARSKDLRSRVSKVPAKVRVIPSDDPRFETIARMALGRRLNLRDGDGALQRWRGDCVLLELDPYFGEERAAAASAAVEAAATPEAAEATPGAAAREEDIHVEAQVDQAVYDQLIADGKSERVARAKAKAAYVRAEKARIRAERAEAVSS
ncbi:MAG: hypothetical protein M3415_00985 [Actinomycetota bacterium]|nr:hypothetical protein [Actinomycetota bacterium]